MSVVNWSNITDFGQLPAAANTAGAGMFWSSMLIMLWIILFLIFIFYGFEVSILVSSFLALIIALFLAYAELIGWGYVVTFAGIILFTFLYITWSGKKQG